MPAVTAGGGGSGSCRALPLLLLLHICHLAYSSLWLLTVARAFICLSASLGVDLEGGARQTFILGLEGRRKPTVCFVPGCTSPVCVHFGRNQWKMLTPADLGRVSMTLSSAGEQGGRQISSWLPAFTLPTCINC